HLDVRQDQDARIVRVVKLIDHVRLRRPDAAREGDELRRRQRLRTQPDHLTVVEHALDVAEGGIGQRLRQVDAENVGAEACTERSHLEHGLDDAIIAPAGPDANTAGDGPAGSRAMKLVTWNTQWCCGLDGTVSPQRIVEGARALA